MNVDALAARRDAPVVYDSARRGSAPLEELQSAWQYRDLIAQLISRDVKARYKRSVLGIAWTMLNPLLMMAILTLVFSEFFRFEVRHYPVYLLSAMIMWNFIGQTTTAAMSHLLWGGQLMTRIYVPRTVFALAATGTGLVNLGLALAPLMAIAVISGVPVTPSLLWLPLPIVLGAMFALGAGLFLSTIAIRFPDIVDMYQVLLSALYFLTPIMYPKSIVPVEWHWIFNVNPVYHLIEAFRAPIYASWPAGPNTVLAAASAAVAALVIGWTVFASRADDVPYHL
jgi:ABC-type polysaccharide/polyol phosphate export permease